MTHTKEPWDVFAQPISGAGDAALELVNQVQHTHPIGEAVYLLNAGGLCPATTGCGPTSEANARRIVDCVNALAGIENPAAYVKAAQAMADALGKVVEMSERPDGGGIDTINFLIELSDLAVKCRPTLTDFHAASATPPEPPVFEPFAPVWKERERPTREKKGGAE